MHTVDKVLAHLFRSWWILPIATVWVMAGLGELRQVYDDWKVRRMAREREAELRDAGLWSGN
jgi:hypothetical protein